MLSSFLYLFNHHIRENIMKVKIELTVDINAESWIENYGIESSEVRDDVKGYCKNILLSQLEIIDVLESPK
tara:strand:+ start:648 stop:860 length:213 start_codon:yes stop_codon:yes gene_type:complete